MDFAATRVRAAKTSKVINESTDDLNTQLKEAEKVLDEVHITANKNTIPFDQNKPFVTSGIRLGSPALTTRGMKEGEMKQIAGLMASVIREPNSEEVKTNIKKEVAELTARFPMYPNRLKENRAIAAE